MTEPIRRCPDCGVEMEAMDLYVGGHDLQVVSEESREGILGSLGVNQRFDLETVVCSECGLTRLYAALDE